MNAIPDQLIAQSRLGERCEVERSTEVAQRGIRDIGSGGNLSRLAPVGYRGLGVGRALVVVRDEPVELGGALAALGHQPLGGQVVLQALVVPEHAVIRHLMQQVVLERELAHAVEGAGLTTADQIAA